VLRTFADGGLIGSSSGIARPDVLALHGWARTHRDFDGVVAAIEGDGPADGPADPPLDAIALDLAGFGSAPAPPEPWGTPEYARAVALVMADMAPRIVIVGHSFGGRVALHLAAGWPDRVHALVLTGVPLRPPETGRRPSRRFRLARRLHRAGLIGEGRMEAFRQRHGSADYRNAEGVMRQVLVKTLAERYDEALASIRCPVELVWGDDDADAPLEMARAASASLAHASWTVCAGAGHLTPLTVPRVLHRSVRHALG
jgi:pimeloyl-ACP methyl ester carboxylesterase